MLLFCTAVSALWAGGQEHRCRLDTQECLDSMVRRMERRGWLGVVIGRHGPHGPEVERVMPDSPAQKAGLRAGDELVGIDGRRYEERSPELARLYDALQPGRVVTYLVRRGDEEFELAIQLLPWPEEVKFQHIGRHMVMHHAHRDKPL